MGWGERERDSVMRGNAGPVDQIEEGVRDETDGRLGGVGTSNSRRRTDFLVHEPNKKN